MKLFADGNFYMNDYLKGKQAVIDAACFDYYIMQSTMKIKEYTFDNIDESEDIPKEVKMCCCELAEIMSEEDKRQAETGGVLSESVGGWSKSYENSEIAAKQFESKLKASVYKWLGNTGLLYCGVAIC